MRSEHVPPINLALQPLLIRQRRVSLSQMLSPFQLHQIPVVPVQSTTLVQPAEPTTDPILQRPVVSVQRHQHPPRTYRPTKLPRWHLQTLVLKFHPYTLEADHAMISVPAKPTTAQVRPWTHYLSSVPTLKNPIPATLFRRKFSIS